MVKQGLGAGIHMKKPITKKNILNVVTLMTNEERIPHILSLAVQGNWVKWDNVIDLDLK